MATRDFEFWKINVVSEQMLVLFVTCTQKELLETLALHNYRTMSWIIHCIIVIGAFKLGRLSQSGTSDLDFFHGLVWGFIIPKLTQIQSGSRCDAA